jgi:ribosomal protein S18 acetylase RimI-like enzyme
VPDIKLLFPEQWPALRDIRLTALSESPDSFLSTFEREMSYQEEQWRAEFVRGDWSIGVRNQEAVTLLGATREADTPQEQCFLEYMWVAPRFRRSGFALHTLRVVLARLRTSGVRTVLLWVLNGNKPAEELYKSVGFESANVSQPLPDAPERTEELMRLRFR